MMRRVLFCLLALAAGVSALLGVAACNSSSQASDKPTVVSTIFAYYDIVRAVGGDYVKPVILLPPRTSPHDYSPTLTDRRAVQNASLIVRNGLGLDDWIDTMVGPDQRTHMINIAQAIDVTPLQTPEFETEATLPPAGATTPATAAAGAGHDARLHGGAVGNPHIWLDPHNQMAAADAIADALAKMDPAHADDYKANAAKYVQQLQQLDQQFQQAAAHFKQKDFVGFHSAYDYLAHRYGLRQVASLEEVEEAGMSVAQARRVIELINRDHIKAIFVETAMPSKDADMIVNQTHVKKLVLQPLETYDSLQDTYVGLMEQNLKNLKEALD